jgi:hypothetical protein
MGEAVTSGMATCLACPAAGAFRYDVQVTEPS